jgi:hypothetical protein
MTRAAAVVLTFLLFAACSSAAPSTDKRGNSLSLPEGGGQEDRKEGGAPAEKKKSDEREPSGAKEKDGDDGVAGDTHESKDRSGDGSDTSKPKGVRLALPAAGSYTYTQSGWEELCQASNCDRSDLPPSNSVQISFQEKRADRATFISETDGSGSRSQAITYDVRREGAFITKLESTFRNGAFSLTAEVVPAPPVLAARFPFQTGDSWSGKWVDRNGKTDGSYAFRVIGRDRMSIDGRDEEVVVLDMEMDLSGEYRGRNDMRLWVIPDRFTIAASKGFTEVESQYGTYRSRFSTSYRSGPR